MWPRSRALTPRKGCSRRPPHLFFRRRLHKKYRMRKKHKKPARRDVRTMYRRYKRRKRLAGRLLRTKHKKYRKRTRYILYKKRTRYNMRGVHKKYRRYKMLSKWNPYPLLMGTVIPRAGRASGCPALIWLFPLKTVPGLLR